MQFADVFKRLCKEAGVTQKRVLADLELGRNAAQRWADGFPNAETITKIASYFEIPVDWLFHPQDLEYNLNQKRRSEVTSAQTSKSVDSLIAAAEQKKEPAPMSGNGQHMYDLKVLTWFHSLPEEKRQAILALGDAPAELREAPGRAQSLRSADLPRTK